MPAVYSRTFPYGKDARCNVSHFRLPLLRPSPLAQELPLSIEVRGGAAVPTGDWNEDDFAETALGFGAAVTIRPVPLAGIYAGWDRFTFGVDEGEPGELEEEVDASVIDTNFRIGAEVGMPLVGMPVSPFASAGLVYGKTEFEIASDDGAFGIKTDSSIGFEAAVGLGFYAGPLTLRPAVGYRTRERKTAGSGDDSDNESISCFTFILGVSLVP